MANVSLNISSEDQAVSESMQEVTQDSVASSRRNSGSSNSYTPGPRSSTLRPPMLKKSRLRKTSFQGDQVAPDMRPVLHLFDVFSRKLYMEGYLCRQDILSNKGHQSTSNIWSEFYAELCGSILSLWKIENNFDSGQPEIAQTPIIINVSNYSTEICSPVLDDGIQRNNVFLLSAGPGDKFYLQAANDSLLNLWVSAIRLSCYESSRLQEVYTATLLKRTGLRELLSGTVLVKGKLEGYLQVQFTSTDEPKKYWVVVSDHRAEDKKKKADLAFTRGQALFYETKKSKKPFMTLANVLKTYAIYPENPTIIDKTISFRVEGNLFPAKQTDSKPGDFVNLSAESINEMAKWLIGFFDSFKMYGRPKELLYDFKDPISPFFAVPTGRNNVKLFLDLHEIEHVDMREPLADVKAAFAEVLRQSYQNQDGSQQTLSVPNHQQSSNILKTLSSSPQIVTDGSNDNYIRQRVLSSESLSSGPNSQLTHKISTQASHSSPILSLTQSTSKESVSSLTNNGLTSGKGKKLKQIASSDESEGDNGKNRDQLESDNEESESDDGDDYNDYNDYNDPAVLKNTQENAKVAKEHSENNLTLTVDEHIRLGSSFNSLSGGDLMLEIMNAVTDRNDTVKSSEETNDVLKKQPKTKRNVSFKNLSTKSGMNHKKKIAPLPSESEDNEELSSVGTKSDENDSDGSSEDISVNKNEDRHANVNVNKKRNTGKRHIRTAPQPSDSSDNEEEELMEEDQQLPKPYGSNRSKSQGKQAKGKKDEEEIDSENEARVVQPLKNKPGNQGDFKGSSQFNKNSGVQQRDNYQFDLPNVDVNLGLDFNSLSFNASVTTEKKDLKAQELTSEGETSDDEVINRTNKVFKPTKRNNKLKIIANPSTKSSDASSSDEEKEPLAILVDEVGFNRSNFGTSSRSASPSYPPGQRWGQHQNYNGYYADNMNYQPADNRRNVFNHRGVEYYDDDHSSFSGSRPRSFIGPGHIPSGRRRVSGGQMDYSDDGYSDDRGNLFPPPNHFRPNSLLDSMPQSQPSAREQEQMARETGAPLINLQEKPKDPQTGLVGAITAREQHRKAIGSGLLARNAEIERERAFDRERERRLIEQRQQMMSERERDYMHSRQSHMGPNRYYANQQYLEPVVGQRGSYYESYGTDDGYDDDIPLGIGGSAVSSGHSRQLRGTRNAGRRRDID
ncbi:2521_t:CDS:1 [Dentiscutata erythropus]|uniref:2521_t:CDS:1 n=1 Tax=Dentiscutata erythropus TaxID=1348616 RepID=A0A9N9CCS9_9GLOM|nr:2521_t:CDS:1 [Dentiscutata erythropus]